MSNNCFPKSCNAKPSRLLPCAFFVTLFVLLFHLPGIQAHAEQIAAPNGYDTIDLPGIKLFHHPRDKKAAEKLADQARGIRRQMAADLDLKHPGTVFVIMAASGEDYKTLQPTMNHRPEWSVGVAFPGKRLIIIHSPRASGKKGFKKNTTTVFTHELAHVFLAESLSPARVPRWLQEGYAKWRAREITLGLSTEMTWAYILGKLIPLEELINNFPKSAGMAKLAYAESVSFVAYLHHELGPNGFHTLLARIRSTGNVSSALKQTTDMDLATLESEWLTYMALHYTVLRILVDSGTLWAVAGIIIVFGWLKVRHRKKLRLAQMETEEAAYYGVSKHLSLVNKDAQDKDDDDDDDSGGPSPGGYLN